MKNSRKNAISEIQNIVVEVPSWICGIESVLKEAIEGEINKGKARSKLSVILKLTETERATKKLSAAAKKAEMLKRKIDKARKTLIDAGVFKN
jgi:hypothetical protein